MASRGSRRDVTAPLAVAITLGVLITGTGTWFFLSGTLHSLERRSAITYAALGLAAALAASVWFRRMGLTPAKRDPLWFLFRLCGALSLVLLAVLFLWQGLYPPVPLLWNSVGTFSALALAVTYVALALCRVVQRIRGQYHASGT